MIIIKKYRNLLLHLLVILLTVPTFWSLLRPGFFPMQDDLQAFRVFEMDKCFQDGQFPCRWVPDAGYLYGYPQFEFYPPSVYYLGELFHLTGLQFIDSVKILFVLGYLLSALVMFLLLKEIFGEFPALVGATLYSYVPYKAVEVYVRGAMSEFWALVLFPLIFWSAYLLIKSGKLKYLAFLALSTAGLLLTHNLMSLIFFPLVGVWCLVWLILEKKWKVLPKLVVAFLLGLGLAAFFTVPVLLEKQYVHVESLLGGYFDYRQHFVDIKNLFLSNRWGYGSSNLGQTEALNLSTGLVQWIAGVVAVVLALVSFKTQKKVSVVILVLGVFELIVLFMMHQKSTFIWEKLPQLWYLQFPWRFMADSIFLLSILASGAVYLAGKAKLGWAFGLVCMVGAVFLYISFFQPRGWLSITDQDKFSGSSWQKQLTISIFDYLPIYAKLPPITAAPAVPEVLEGKADFSSYRKGSDWQKGEVQVLEPALLRLPLFDFPGMWVAVDGKRVSHLHDDCRGQEFCLGLVTFNVPSGNHIIETRLGNTLVRGVGNAISLFSLIVLGGVVLFGFKKKSR